MSVAPGSVTEGVVRNASASLLVVRDRKGEEREAGREEVGREAVGHA